MTEPRHRPTSHAAAVRIVEAPVDSDDGVRWLALLLLKSALVVVNGVRGRYRLSKGERCPRCGHSY